ncbi:MAG: adenosylcobinamide-GDP ribazoletransferase [Anaerovoracaceae bacterium]
MIKGFFMAWGCFCAVPCPLKLWDEQARKWMLAMFPLVGGLMGLGWYGIALLLVHFSVFPAISGVVLCAYPFFVSGCIHLDGFMDCSDAILSRRDLAKRQEILKDSHVGAFAVISLCFMLLFFFAGAEAMISEGNREKFLLLIAVMPLVRGVSALTVLLAKPISASQYKASFGGKRKIYVWTITIILALFVTGVSWLLLRGGQGSLAMTLVAPPVAAALAMTYGRRSLGGMSGDISGYGIVFGELIGMLTIALV